MVAWLIDRGAKVNFRDFRGWTALHSAVYKPLYDPPLYTSNSLALVKILLRYGAEINSMTNSHMTPLFMASQEESEELGRLLLDNGAAVEGLYKHNRTALDLATSRDHAKIVQILLEHGAAGRDPKSKLAPLLCRAAAEGHMAIVEQFLNCGADVDTQDSGYPILYVALKKGQDNTAKLTIERGANINKPKLMPRSVMEVAIANSCSKAVEAMIERGADVMSRDDEWGFSPLGHGSLSP